MGDSLILNLVLHKYRKHFAKKEPTHLHVPGTLILFFESTPFYQRNAENLRCTRKKKNFQYKELRSCNPYFTNRHVGEIIVSVLGDSNSFHEP